MELFNKEGFSVVLCFERNDEGMLTFFCEFCNLFHHHGREEGHRVSHCLKKESPYFNNGYILYNVSKLEREEVNQLIKINKEANHGIR